jgi:hypothetical protein
MPKTKTVMKQGTKSSSDTSSSMMLAGFALERVCRAPKHTHNNVSAGTT